MAFGARHMTKPLRIRLLLDAARARIWHRRLAEGLTARGHQVSLEVRRGGPAAPLAVPLLLTLEGLVYRQNGMTASAAWHLPVQASPADSLDLILDMTGATEALGSTRTLRPVYANALLEEAVIAAVLSGSTPEIGILDSASGTAPRMSRAAIERPRVLCKALDNLCARLATIFAAAVEDIAHGRDLQGRTGAPLDRSAAAQLTMLAALTGRARAALTSLSSKAPHWFVGWRQADADRISQTLRAPTSGWTRLPDDGARFYADPFVFRKDERTWLFLEEFPYAVGKALISVVELGPDGPLGTPRPIIERSYHLSYPFVFERDGEIWMLPETSAAHRVELLRATKFPDAWETAAILIESKDVADATIVEHDNRLWLFGSQSENDESSWDALHIWHAATLTGDWQPHERNPVLIDAGSARPAGAFFRRNGELWRPAQDCTRGYGSGLTLARITKLNEQRFSQEVQTVLYPDAAWPGIGLHTLNWSAGFEVVDGASAGKAI